MHTHICGIRYIPIPNGKLDTFTSEFDPSIGCGHIWEHENGDVDKHRCPACGMPTTPIQATMSDIIMVITDERAKAAYCNHLKNIEKNLRRTE